MDFIGDRTTEGIIKFIKFNAYNKIVDDEEKKDDKKEGKTSDL